jgi:hypothetical protein
MADLTAVASALTTLRNDMLGVGSFVGMDPAQLAQIITDANTAASAVNDAADLAETTLAGSGTAGVTLVDDAAVSAAAFLDYAAAAAQAAWLNDMGNYLVRIGLNLSQGAA